MGLCPARLQRVPCPEPLVIRSSELHHALSPAPTVQRLLLKRQPMSLKPNQTKATMVSILHHQEGEQLTKNAQSRFPIWTCDPSAHCPHQVRDTASVGARGQSRQLRAVPLSEWKPNSHLAEGTVEAWEWKRLHSLALSMGRDLPLSLVQVVGGGRDGSLTAESHSLELGSSCSVERARGGSVQGQHRRGRLVLTPECVLRSALVFPHPRLSNLSYPQAPAQ
jgi:hypothetical protein